MNTKFLMTASALFMGALGILASFLPQELLKHAGSRPEGLGVLMIQITGALYLGFAMLNWSARENLIGGIYSRPIAMANFFHFVVAALALVKALIAGQHAPEVLIVSVVYTAFAVSFGVVLSTHPIRA